MIFATAKLVAAGFYLLFFLVPLALFPTTSEIFEFNKIVLTYALTAFILASWVARIIVAKKIIFRRSLLDIPILLFLASQVASTFLSIDTRTSLFGYYSRFNGGLMSLFSYALLYWAYVSNMTAKESKNSLIALLSSSYLIGAYAVLQRMGVDKDIWNQNVQERVFSTFGQPNWLAAWISALLPIVWAFLLIYADKARDSKNNIRFWFLFLFSPFLFLIILFTKSRSGILGFLAADLLFWAIAILPKRNNLLEFSKIVKIFIAANLAFVLLAVVVGTPWTPSGPEALMAGGRKIPSTEAATSSPSDPGGTESGEIRKIVWKGAINIWKAYPLFGTGVETFAFSYPTFRPAEHNLVSEWEFIYNKAHNEYLNFAANTGSVGLISYLFLIVVIAISFYRNYGLPTHNFNNSQQMSNSKLINLALLSGWASILITNFFGFSTVPISILFFLYPAVALVIASPTQSKFGNTHSQNLSVGQKITIFSSLLVTSYLLLVISKYWYADYLYAQAKAENDSGNYTQGGEIMLKAIKLSRGEAIYYDELAQSSAGVAVKVSEASDSNNAEKFAQQAIALSDNAVKLSPRNITLRKHQAGLFIKLTAIDTSYLYSARDVMAEIAPLSPTDAKLFYNLGLTLARTGNVDEAVKILKKSTELKPDFRDARFTIALLEMENDNLEEAKVQLEYILNKINPDDILAKQQLEELGF